MSSQIIHVIALAEASPQHADEVKQILAKLADFSRMEEGCLRYDVFCDAGNPLLINTIEAWESVEALERHITSTHVIQGVTSLLGKLAGIPQIRTLRPLNVIDDV